MDADLDAVVQENARFYRAVESMDMTTMAQRWTCTREDVCIHPGWPILSGWDEIAQSWEAIFQGTIYMKFDLTEVEVRLRGEIAQVHCVENIYTVASGLQSHSQVAATNLFVWRDGAWRLTLHHGSPMSHTVSRADADTDDVN